jgi:hypothetical protein
MAKREDIKPGTQLACYNERSHHSEYRIEGALAHAVEVLTDYGPRKCKEKGDVFNPGVHNRTINGWAVRFVNPSVSDKMYRPYINTNTKVLGFENAFLLYAHNTAKWKTVGDLLDIQAQARQDAVAEKKRQQEEDARDKAMLAKLRHKQPTIRRLRELLPGAVIEPEVLAHAFGEIRFAIKITDPDTLEAFIQIVRKGLPADA